jgi:threonine dehydrogenase-like Zn-dependent dehydrogenase
VIDISEERLDIARKFIPGVKTWNPRHKIPIDSGFDICIELSGKLAGLQVAVDNTIYSGKIVIGSWYSAAEKILLNTVFHRSHITIKASQVSTIPTHLSGRWTKRRRFDTTWDILKQIKPSKLLKLGCNRIHINQKSLSDLTDLNQNIISAYEKLEKGLDLTLLIDYRESL